MSPSTLIQSAGFSVLQVTDGEPLTLVVDANTNVALVCVVNRNIFKGRDFFRLFKEFAGDFQVMGLTEVEIAKADLSSPPEAGQVFLDAFGYRHRVRCVGQTDISWLAFCTPSKVNVSRKLTPLQDVTGDVILDTGGGQIIE